MKPQYILVIVTAPSTETGQHIADMLIQSKLAACVNLLSPVTSHYLWQGEKIADEEVLLLIKTRAELFDHELVPAIQSVHPYQVPEIIALPILMGSQIYLEWIDEMTRK